MDVQFTLVIGNRNYSSWSLRPWFFLRVSGVRFAEIRIPLDQPETRAAIAAHSPTGRVPVLHDGDIRVWESLAICEYAAERCGLEGWPAEPPSRAVARAVAHEMHAGFHAMRNEFPMNCRARRRGVVPSPAAAADIRRISEIWSQCRENFGADGPWLCGPFSIADAMYAPVVMRSRTYGWDLPDSAETYAQQVAAHPALLEWVTKAKAETESIPNEEVGEDY